METKRKNIIPKEYIENGLEEFSEYILKDIIEDGYKDDEIVEEFKKRSQELRESAKELIKEVDEVAQSSDKYARIDDVFKWD